MKKLEFQIINKAKELFLTKGFKSVTMDDIANEMAMSKKTIYQYFKTKTDLVSSTTDAIFNHIDSGINEIKLLKLNPIKELFTINDYVLENLNNETTTPDYQLSKYYPEIHYKLNSLKFKIVKKCITENLERGVTLELYRKNTNVEMITGFYFISITGIRNQDIFPIKKFKPKQINRSYLNYHIRGIATQKGIDYLEKIKSKTLTNL